jgi:hypothetical protein
MLEVYNSNVSVVLEVCCTYVANVDQDVANIDQDVGYVAMVVHVCCKRLSLMFRIFFQTYVASVFISMLYMFHIYVASVLSACCVCEQGFQVRFCKCFRHMF